ncbi:MAG: methyltransferase domain-containing protein [bacterium]
MIAISIFLLGFTAIGSQIVIIREFLGVFYGNEFSIGFIFGCWLLGGAIGSSLFGRFADKIKNNASFFSSCQIALSILLPINIFFIRSIKEIFNIVAGEIISIHIMGASTFIILIPLCSIFGFMFSLGCRMIETKSISAFSIGMAYALEAIGCAIGGSLSSFFLIKIFNSFEIMGIFALLNILMAFFLAKRFISIFLSLFFVGMFLSNGWNCLNEYSVKRQFKGYKLLTSQNSIYGNISLVQRQNQYSFFYNGIYLYTIPDRASSEEACNFNLLSHPKPESILLIGGGCGVITEILKHPVKNVDYVELDPLIIKIAKDYLPNNHLKDRRVNIKNMDGRFFIKTTDKKYDCVIVSVGSPYTAQLNRYYSIEFFREVKRVLGKNGIISFGLSSSENYISHQLRDFLSSIYASLKKVFCDVKIIPGDTIYFLACNKKGVLTYDYKLWMERIEMRNLDIKYIREYYLFERMSKERIAKIESVLNKTNARMNYDERPISYYLNLVFWLGRFGNSLSTKIMGWVQEKRIIKIAICFYFLIFLFCFLSYKKAILGAIITTGVTEIAFQTLVLLSFQIIYGYMFYKLGIIITSFMIGLSLGSFWIIGIMHKIKKDFPAFILTQIAICLYPLLIPLFFYLSKGDVFPFLPIIAGFVGGIRFTLANKIYLKGRTDIGRTAGLSYGMILLGSCLGSISIPIFFIPIIGIYKTSLFIAGMNIVVLIFLVSGAHTTKNSLQKTFF